MNINELYNLIISYGLLNALNIELLDSIVKYSNSKIERNLKNYLLTIKGICDSCDKWGDGLNGVVFELLIRKIINPTSKRNFMARAKSLDTYLNRQNCEVKSGCGNCDFLFNNNLKGFVIYSFFQCNSNTKNIPRYTTPLIFTKEQFYNIIVENNFYEKKNNGYHIKGQSAKLYKMLEQLEGEGQPNIYDYFND